MFLGQIYWDYKARVVEKFGWKLIKENRKETKNVSTNFSRCRKVREWTSVGSRIRVTRKQNACTYSGWTFFVFENVKATWCITTGRIYRLTVFCPEWIITLVNVTRSFHPPPRVPVSFVFESRLFIDRKIYFSFPFSSYVQIFINNEQSKVHCVYLFKTSTCRCRPNIIEFPFLKQNVPSLTRKFGYHIVSTNSDRHSAHDNYSLN